MISPGFYSAAIESEPAKVTGSKFSAVFAWLTEIGEAQASEAINALCSWDDPFSPWKLWVSPVYTQKDVSFKGKWTTRFSKFCRKVRGFSIRPDLLSRIGAQLFETNTKETNLIFEIASFGDWEHGAFEGKTSSDGHPPGPCWFTGSSASYRTGMIDSGKGFSILFYKTEEDREKNSKKKGIGRCWLLELDNDRYVIFNAYGIRLGMIAKALYLTFGMRYAQAEVVSNHAFINRGMLDNEGRGGGVGKKGVGYVLGKIGSLPTYVELPDLRKRDHVCDLCCLPTIRSECSRTIGGNLICPDCCSIHTRCRGCGGLTLETKKTKIGETLCEHCYNRCEICIFCGPVLAPVRPLWHHRGKVCVHCITEKKASTCSHCRRRVLNPVQVDIGSHRFTLCKTDARKLKKRLP